MFPPGTDFERLECVGSMLLANVIHEGERVEVVVIGPCPHCRAALRDTPSGECQQPTSFP